MLNGNSILTLSLLNLNLFLWQLVRNSSTLLLKQNYVAAHADLTQRLFLNKFKPVFTEATTPTAGTLSGKKVFVFELSEATGVLVEYANLDF